MPPSPLPGRKRPLTTLINRETSNLAYCTLPSHLPGLDTKPLSRCLPGDVTQARVLTAPPGPQHWALPKCHQAAHTLINISVLLLLICLLPVSLPGPQQEKERRKSKRLVYLPYVSPILPSICPSRRPSPQPSLQPRACTPRALRTSGSSRTDLHWEGRGQAGL